MMSSMFSPFPFQVLDKLLGGFGLLGIFSIGYFLSGFTWRLKN